MDRGTGQRLRGQRTVTAKETAVAAESLRMQADALAKTVAPFRL